MNKKHIRSTFRNPAVFTSYFNQPKAHSIHATGQTAALKKLPIRWYWMSKLYGTYYRGMNPSHIRHTSRAARQVSKSKPSGEPAAPVKRSRKTSYMLYVITVLKHILNIIKNAFTKRFQSL